MPAIYPPTGSRMATFQRHVALKILPFVFPAVVSVAIAREIKAWESYGFLIGDPVPMARLIDDILKRGEKINAARSEAQQ